LCHPIVKSDGEIIGVLELHRGGNETQFYKEDEEIVHSYLVWGGIALHYADLNSIMNKQKKLNEFLLGVVR
jgi:cAMP and cAMP-inhibited cGMP 3',5'-cyclic phosphodiesterase 10